MIESSRRLANKKKSLNSISPCSESPSAFSTRTTTDNVGISGLVSVWLYLRLGVYLAGPEGWGGKLLIFA